MSAVTEVGVINYGLCNLDSIVRALECCGASAIVVDTPDAARDADRLVLPGVGAFPEAMKNLRERDLVDAIVEKAQHQQTPLLGVCLGMQLLATLGTEFDECPGLNLIPGTVRRLVSSDGGDRVPHMGWNQLTRQQASPLLEDVPEEKDFYFVHSFHFEPDDDSAIVATTPHCGGFVSVIQNGNVFGTQFHPEKSQRAGFALLGSFLSF